MRTISIVLDCGATMKILCFFVITISAKLVEALEMANYSLYTSIVSTIHLFTAIMCSSLPLVNNRGQQIKGKIAKKFDSLQYRMCPTLRINNQIMLSKHALISRMSLIYRNLANDSLRI